jgi:hypothetical protein
MQVERMLADISYAVIFQELLEGPNITFDS